jgi:hypothetical protein
MIRYFYGKRAGIDPATGTWQMRVEMDDTIVYLHRDPDDNMLWLDSDGVLWTVEEEISRETEMKTGRYLCTVYNGNFVVSNIPVWSAPGIEGNPWRLYVSAIYDTPDPESTEDEPQEHPHLVVLRYANPDNTEKVDKMYCLDEVNEESITKFIDMIKDLTIQPSTGDWTTAEPEEIEELMRQLPELAIQAREELEAEEKRMVEELFADIRLQIDDFEEEEPENEAPRIPDEWKF